MAAPLLGIAQSQFFTSLAMLSAGTSYVFSLYGPSLSNIMRLNQSQTSFIAICGNAGVFITGPFWGYLCDRFQNRNSYFFAIGGSLIAIGYYSISVFVSSALLDRNANDLAADRPVHYLVLSALNFLVGTGSSSIYHCSLSTNYRNWPSSYRSVAVGLSVSFFGLSAFVFASIGSRFFTTKNGSGTLQVDSFLQLLAFGCFAINVLTAIFLHPIERLESPVIPFAVSPSASLPFFRNRTSVSAEEFEEEENVPLLIERPGATIGAVQDFEDYQEEIEEQRTPEVDNYDFLPPPPPRSLSLDFLGSSSNFRTSSNERTPLLTRVGGGLQLSNSEEAQISLGLGEPLMVTALQPIAIVLDDVPYFTAFDAHLLAFIMFTLAGVGLMYINNVGSIVLSLFPPDSSSNDPILQSTIKNHVQMLSIGSFLARILFGVLSDFFFLFGLKKSVWAIVCCILLLVGQLFITSNSLGQLSLDSLYGTTFLVAIAYGGAFTVLPILVGQYFGLKNFSRNWGWMTVVPAIGGQAFSFVFAKEYDMATGEGHDHCSRGVECFEKVFDGAFIMTMLSMCMAAYLVWKRA